MAIQNNITSKAKPADDFMRIQDLLSLCLEKWYWFVVSLAITVCAAAVYLLTTPPVYTRSAAVLIKEDSKGKPRGSVAGVLGDIDIFRTSTNVNNEIQSLRSPSVMLDVVKRLHLEISYSTEGGFYKKALYGRTCPYQVSFAGLQDNFRAAFTIVPAGKGQVKLTDFELDGEGVDGEVTAKLNVPSTTPVGKVTVMAGVAEASGAPVYVSRIGYQAAAEGYSAKLSAELNDEKSSIINLTFTDVCPQRAEDVLNTVIAVYNENWIKDKNQIAVSTSAFIKERLGVIEQELGNVDKDISSFKSQHLVPDVQAAANMYMTQSSEASAQILALNTQLSMARFIRDYLTNVTSKNQLLPANSGIESPGIEDQIVNYNTTQLRRNELAANSSETNPLVVDMDQSLGEMRSAIVTSVDNLITTLNTQLRAMQQSERQTTARISANPSQGKYLLSVERQQKVKEALYIFLLQKREENELSQAFTAYNTRVITPPTGSFAPTAPVKKNILLVAIALGLLVPVIVIFIRENTNTKLRGRKDLENLSLPFVGEVPLVRSGKKKEDFAHPLVVIKPGCRDMVNEAFRVLRTNMEFLLEASNGGRASVILFTSFNPGSGKTFMAMNMAAAFALKGKKVLVVDGDMRRASASTYLATHGAKGLSDFLGNMHDDAAGLVVQHPDMPGLHLLPAGTIPPNPTELLAEPRFCELIGQLRGSYDYVFIDCPPIDIVADTQIIEKQVDRTVFVVRAGLLERDMLPNLQRMYDEKRFKNMALVLNGTEPLGRRYGSHYGGEYGYQYGYGSKDYYYSEK